MRTIVLTDAETRLLHTALERAAHDYYLLGSDSEYDEDEMVAKLLELLKVD